MIGGSALIVGAARDCAAGLRRTLERIERLRESFDETKLVFVTNDCSDDTERLLRSWASDMHDVHILSVDGLAANVPKRTARLAVVRNLHLSVLRDDLARGREHEFLVVLDLDGVNEALVEEPLLSNAIAGAPADWAGLFPNQRQIYYDIWALRHPTWCPTDCWAEVRKANRGLFKSKARRKAAVVEFVMKRQRIIASDAAPIPVRSAFGGFGIYRTKALENAHYVGLGPDGAEVCEHVSFNEAIAESGGALYIVPSLLNDAPIEHVQEYGLKAISGKDDVCLTN